MIRYSCIRGRTGAQPTGSMKNVSTHHHPGPPCTCGEHLLQVQHCMDESLRAHCLACSPLQGSQGSPCQDATGACRTQRKAPVMRPSVQCHQSHALCAAQRPGTRTTSKTGVEGGTLTTGNQGLPRPEPCGSSDHVCSSKPPLKERNNCSCRGSSEWTCTIPVQIKAAFSKAPEG